MNIKTGLATIAVLSVIAVIMNHRNHGQMLNKLANTVKESTKQNSEDNTKTVIAPSALTNGMPEATFKAAFGEPKGEYTKGDQEILSYDNFQVTVQNETITDLPENILEIYTVRNEPSALEKIKDLPKQIPAPQEIKSALAKRKSYTLLDSQNQPIDHTSLVVSGKVTVVEFYAEAIEGSTAVGESLSKLIEPYEKVELNRIEIESWNSETAKQYHINTVPDIRVLNQYGHLVSQPVTRIEAVDNQIDLSRVTEAIQQALKY